MSTNDAFGPAAHASGLQEARQLYERVSGGGRLPSYQPHGIVLQSGEAALGEAVAEYSRYTELSIEYPPPRSLFVMGPPAFMAGALLGKVLGDAADRRAAAKLAALAAPQWRVIGFARVVLTDQRLVAQILGQFELVSFWHGGLVGFTPSTPQFSLQLAYTDCPPVQLRGPRVPWLSVAMASCIYPASGTTQAPAGVLFDFTR